MVTAVTGSSPYPDQMVDQHLEMTSTALNVSGDQDNWMSPTDPQWRPLGGDGHWDKTSGTRWVLCTIWLCCSLELSWFRLNPPNWAWFLPRFFSPILSPIKFWFIATVASVLLSWGHLISSDIVNLIAQILFKLNWAGRWNHWINDELTLTEIECLLLSFCIITHCFPYLIL